MDNLLINTYVILCPAQVQKVICVNVLRHVLQHFLPEKDVPSYNVQLPNTSQTTKGFHHFQTEIYATEKGDRESSVDKVSPKANKQRWVGHIHKRAGKTGCILRGRHFVTTWSNAGTKNVARQLSAEISCLHKHTQDLGASNEILSRAYRAVTLWVGFSSLFFFR